MAGLAQLSPLTATGDDQRDRRKLSPPSPVGPTVPGRLAALARLRADGRQVFAVGVHLALPYDRDAAGGQPAIGVMTRAAPQLNLMSIGFRSA